MLDTEILERVRRALRRTDTTFDGDILELIEAAQADLQRADITGPLAADGEGLDTSDPLIRRAIITYCKAHFGDAGVEEYDRLAAAYEAQKGQMGMASGYTDWA